MKRETETKCLSKGIEQMTDEELEKMDAEADQYLATQLGVSALDGLIGMGRFYGGDQCMLERYMRTNPEFAEALDRYLLEVHEYLASLKKYLGFDAEEAWHKQRDEKLRKKCEQGESW
jgi:hypothetical protein